MNKINRNERRVIHLQNGEPIVNMKYILVILLAVVCQHTHQSQNKVG